MRKVITHNTRVDYQFNSKSPKRERVRGGGGGGGGGGRGGEKKHPDTMTEKVFGVFDSYKLSELY